MLNTFLDRTKSIAKERFSPSTTGGNRGNFFHLYPSAISPFVPEIVTKEGISRFERTPPAVRSTQGRGNRKRVILVAHVGSQDHLASPEKEATGF